MTPAAGAFSVAPFVREIGRGKDGARALSLERARELMAAILAGEVDDLALGAVLLALRMKGESATEIAGFRDALEPHLVRVAPVTPGWVLIPSYNGARSIANLVPLLALLLARRGVPVLVHGQGSEPAFVARPRVTSAAIFAALELAPCLPSEAPARSADGLPAFVELAALCPALARLIALRARLGVRNVAHTLAKVLRPVSGPCLLVSSFTHPEFGRMQAELFRSSGEHALTMRATDGEAVVSARRTQAVDCWRNGVCTPAIAAQPIADALATLPTADLAATAQWTRDVLRGVCPAPPALLAQVELIERELRAP